MRLFVFLPQLPYPAHSGGRIVTAPLVEGLARDHEVHLFSLLHGYEGEEEGLQYLSDRLASIDVVPGSKRISPKPVLRALWTQKPYKVERFFDHSLLEKALVRAEKTPPDAIHCQNFYTAEYGRRLQAARKILYQENFENRLLGRWAESVKNPLKRGLIRVEQRRTLDYELKALEWFDQVVCISHKDEELYRQAAESVSPNRSDGGRKLTTIPPGIQLDYYHPDKVQGMESPFLRDERINLVFTGSFNYLANVDGAQWFVREVLPLLRGERYRLWLVGQRPEESVKALHAPPHVMVTGSVADIRPYLFHADVSVVPLWIGGGIRLKILEAMALGCPLVSTSVGCEGLWREGDPPLWKIADSPKAFAQAIEKAVDEPRERERLREWVTARYSPERFIREMEKVYSIQTS